MLWDTSKFILLKILKRTLELVLQNFFPNPSPIINGPNSRHDEFGRITWLFIGDGEHVPTHLHHGLHCFNIHAVHPIDLFLHFFNHHGRLLLESEFFVKEHFPT